MSDDYEYDGQPDQCHECDQPAVGWDGSSGAMLCAAHYKRPSTPKTVEYAGQGTEGEARAYQEGFDAGLLANEGQVKHVVGVLEDLYEAIDTSHLDDDLRDDIREILKGDV